MGKAIIFLVDDHSVLRRAVKLSLEEFGHSVVLEAGALEEALGKIKKAKKSGVNLAILDGSLDRRGVTEDGHKIADALRKEIPGIKIISFSAAAGAITWGDYNFSKYGDFSEIWDLIDALFKKD